MTLTAFLRRVGCPVAADGFRSTFRDWAGSTTAYPRAVIEHALAHQLEDKAEAAYALGTLFDKRRGLLGWEDFPAGRLTRATAGGPGSPRRDEFAFHSGCIHTGAGTMGSTT